MPDLLRAFRENPRSRGDASPRKQSRRVSLPSKRFRMRCCSCILDGNTALGAVATLLKRDRGALMRNADGSAG
ncbi:hypothetical protein KCP69_03740 [Salmonella enterica subsp. enterica]|nr:hypothetical protein KCP69_03740 [Salmonella enterica subsp. enterica]